ncbi:MAG: CBM21 domain-containing protein [Clostridia bacterium]|nr:CBM21 domain-containing protein [Clostridia bacterium]
MKNKKIFSRIAAIAMAITMSLAAGFTAPTQKAEAAGEPVKLYYATLKAEGTNTPPYVTYYTKGHISIQNLGTNKKVTVSCNYGTGWTTVPATYVRTASDGYEAWYFETPKSASYATCSFAIKYEVNGATYWDNNGGSNYNLSNANNQKYVMQKSNVVLDNSQKYINSTGATVFEGSVAVKNLAYTKVVKVRYTTDNWVTYKEVSASYGSSVQYNTELWRFSTTVPAGTTIKYAISYTVNGVTYWDNNFGADYSL